VKLCRHFALKFRKELPIKYSSALLLTVLVACPAFGLSQQIALNDLPSANADVSSSSVVVAASAPKAPVKSEKALTERWIDLTEMSESQRYRNSYDENGARLFDNGQQRTVVSGHLKLDREGRYFVGVRASSGKYFNWAYADYAGHDFLSYATLSLNHFTLAEFGQFFAALAADPVGSSYDFSANGWNFYVRDLYISATPIKQATVEFGSIELEHGYNTEITSFDDDGFITGERLRVHDAKHLYLDEVSFTNAYLGDITTPSFFKRSDRLTQTNYRQVAVKKMIRKRVGVSADYTWLNQTNTVREGAFVKTPELKVVDAMRVELYQRVNDVAPQGFTTAHGSGFSVSADKKVGRVSGGAGYAAIDRGYSVYEGSAFLNAVGFSLNGDAYGLGNKVFTHASVKIAPGVTMFGFFTHQTSGDSYTYTKQGINADMKFDLKEMINTGRKVF